MMDFAAKLSSAIEDIDLNLGDFQQRVNSDLVGKVVNIASRCAGFVTKRHDGRLHAELDEPDLVQTLRAAAPAIAASYEARDFSRAMRDIMALADSANQYIDRRKPWALAKDEQATDEVHRICSTGIALFRLLMIYLKPVLPRTAEAVEVFLNCEPLGWSDVETDIGGHTIKRFKPLIQRIETEKIEAMIQDSKQMPAAATAAPAATAPAPAEPATITIEDFAKIDLRVATVIAAKPVEGADKLLQLELAVGDATRTVFAGIKSAYEPAALEGRQVIVVANLKPRKMRFGVSEGMVLAAGPGGEDIFLLSPDAGASSGMQVK